MAAKSQTKVSGKSSKAPLPSNNSKNDTKGKKTVTIADVRLYFYCKKNVNKYNDLVQATTAKSCWFLMNLCDDVGLELKYYQYECGF